MYEEEAVMEKDSAGVFMYLSGGSAGYAGKRSRGR